MTAIISLQILPILLIVFSGVVALLAPALDSLASQSASHRRSLLLIFGGIAAPLAMLGLFLIAVRVLFD
jgi:hypothetical protein